MMCLVYTFALYTNVLVPKRLRNVRFQLNSIVYNEDVGDLTSNMNKGYQTIDFVRMFDIDIVRMDC